MTKHVRPADLRLERKDAGNPPVDEGKKAVSAVMTAFEEFKASNDARLKEIEKRGSADVVLVDKVEKINKELDKYEGINQRLTTAEATAKAVKESVDRVETVLSRLPASQQKSDPAAERKYINDWAHGVLRAPVVGLANIADDHRKALERSVAETKSLSITDDSTGGYLAPVEYVREIIKGVTEISAPRALVRVRSTTQKSVQQPKRTGQFAAVRVLEQGTRSETTGLTYGMVEISAPEMYALVDISQQNLEDSAFDLEAEVREEAVEQFAVKEGSEFVTGSGIGEMEGIVTKATAGGISSTNSGSAAVIADADGQANGLLTLKHAIKTAYARNATWVMNRTTIGAVRKLKDSDKNYIWMPGIALGRPNSIDGDPYVEVPDMPSEGAGNYPIGYGDWRRAYTMVDRIAMGMLRDPYTQATSGNIRLLFRRRVGGLVVLSEAVRMLKCAA